MIDGKGAAKVLLINHHYYSIPRFTTYEKFFDPIPVMGIGYLAAVLRNAGHKIRIIDDYAERFGVEGILDAIERDKPDLVGTSCLTPLAEETFFLSRKIKERFPDLPLVLGHRHADYFAEKIVSEGNADIVVHGEGELTLLELADTKCDPALLPAVQGITYRDSGKAVRTPDRAPIEDLDTIPFPAWDLFPLHLYRPCAEVMPGGKRHLPLLTARGCPYACIFCTQEATRKVRARSPENVIEEIRWVTEQFGVDGLILFDANFPIVRKYAIDFCRMMIESGLNQRARWTTETRPDCVDDELLVLMKRAGCTKVQIGFESGSDRLLKLLRKGFTVAESADVVRRIHGAGISVYGLFMMGIPTETPEEIRQTVDFARKSGIDFAKFNLFVPFPGSPVYEDPEIRSRINATRWFNFTSYPPSADRVVYTPEGIDADELIALQKKAFLRFYLRPKMIYRQIVKIKHIRFTEYWEGFRFVLRSLFDLTFRHRRAKPCAVKTA